MLAQLLKKFLFLYSFWSVSLVLVSLHKISLAERFGCSTRVFDQSACQVFQPPLQLQLDHPECHSLLPYCSKSIVSFVKVFTDFAWVFIQFDNNSSTI